MENDIPDLDTFRKPVGTFYVSAWQGKVVISTFEGPMFPGDGSNPKHVEVLELPTVADLIEKLKATAERAAEGEEDKLDKDELPLAEEYVTKYLSSAEDDEDNPFVY